MNRTGLLAAALVAAIPAAASAAEYTVEAVTEGWIDPPTLPASPTNPNGFTLVLGPKQNAQTRQVTLPFRFSVFGSLRDRVSVSDDGWLAFGSTAEVESVNPELPSERAEDARFAIVAPLWDDLRTKADGQIVTFVQGTAPARTFVVAWRHMDTVSRASLSDVSFEVILHEGTGLLEVAYEKNGTWEGLSYTAGLQDPTGARAFGAPNLTAANSDEPASDWRFVPNAVAITGTVLRNRPQATETGLEKVTESDVGLPVAGARIELIREDTGESFASALTTDDGSFTAVALGIDGAPSLALDLVAAGEESVVNSVDNVTWRRRIATGVVPIGEYSIGGVTLDTAVDDTSPGFRKALNIQQAAHRGYAFARAAAATSTGATTKFPQLEIRWSPNVTAASGYAAANSTTPAKATISDAPTDPDAYDDDVILRTYAAHVYASIAPMPTGTSGYVWAQTASSPELGFFDGFSFWFACAVQGRSKFINTRNPPPVPPATDPGPAVVFELEAPTPPATGASTAGAVAASLWDLVDGVDPAEPRDDFDGKLPKEGHEVLVTLDLRRGAATMPGSATPWTIAKFLTAWRTGAGKEADRAATSRAFIADGTLPDDTSEPNDEAGEEKVFDEVAHRMTGLVLNPFNEDRFTFKMGTVALAVSASFPESTEVEVSVLDETGAVVATAASGTVRSPVVCDVPKLPTGEATYVARVVWKSGPAAHYALGITRRVELVTTSLPAWTAGESFNTTIQLTGGLAPVTIAIEPEVPAGLTLIGAEGRLTGRPAVAGTYDLDIVATDASGSGPQTIGTLQLVVNPALRLFDPIGVAADRTIAVDVGAGGTDATWTAVSAAPAGMTLTDGPTLRLAGPTGGPGAFTVTGSATDSVGATVPARDAHVVVCAPVADAGGVAVDAASAFGFYFDAIAGSTASFDFALNGRGESPKLVVLDEAGTRVDKPGTIELRAGHIAVRNLPVAATGRYFLVFTFDAGAKFEGRVASVRRRVRPTTRVAGIANIETAGALAEVRFHAVKGSTLRVVMRSGLAPEAARPDYIEVEQPDGVKIPTLPTGIVNKAHTLKVVRGIALTQDGEYVVRVGGLANSTGSLSYVVEITPPPGAPFRID